MLAKDWDRFFTLLEDIVHLSEGNNPLPFQDKATTVFQEAKARDSDLALEEFTAWFHDMDFDTGTYPDGTEATG